MKTSKPGIKKTKEFIIWFYIIGFIGFVFPYSKTFFQWLIPLALVLNFIIALFFHEKKINLKLISIFFFIFIIGLGIEMIGVNTGKIFGEYNYGNSLGFKFIKTPLLIGLNWLMLVYYTANIINKFKLNIVLKVFLSSLFMLLYDIFLEQVAHHLDMWHWKDGEVPLLNYISWFSIAFILHMFVKLMRLKLSNKLVSTIFFSQFLFLIALTIYFNFF